MSTPVLTALLGVAGVLGTAALATLTATQTRTTRRLARLEGENRALWRYNRHLIDHIYRGGDPPPPEPPPSIDHLFEYGDTQ